MPTPFVCEPLERRDQWAAAAGAVDPAYLFDAAKARVVIGQDPAVFQALPGPGGRTYLMGARDVGFDDNGRVGKLTIIAVKADGNLDKKFGTKGVALTDRELHYTDDEPGLLKIDGVGRLYFADNTRVLRFRPDGSTDVTFGNHGSADFAPGSRPVQLCDVVPTDDGGVRVATTSTTDGVQRFAVQRIDKKVRTVWQTTYDTGSQDDIDGRYGDPAVGQAQFAVSAGRVVLARVQTVGRLVPDTGVDAGPDDTLFDPIREDMFVTDFDAAGRGTDISQKEIHFYDNYGNDLPAVIGTGDSRYPNLGNTLLYRQGRSLLVLTDREVVQFNLENGHGKWIDLPFNYPDGNVAPGQKYQLFPDGTLGVSLAIHLDKKDRQTDRIDRFNLDGTRVTSFGDHGSATILPSDFATKNPYFIDQMLLGTDGRLYFMASGTNGGSPSSLTLRRV